MDIKPGTFTYQEIISQPEVWQASLETLKSESSRWQKGLQKPTNEVIFIGCGSTYYLSLSAAVTWQAITGTPARGLPSSEIWLFPQASLSSSNALLIAVSRSGETTETLHAIETFQSRSFSDWIAVTCYADSRLARIAPQLVLAQKAEEQSVAQTRSFSSMYLLVQGLAALAGGQNQMLDHLLTLPRHLKRLLPDYESLAQRFAEDQQLQHFIFLGSNANYGLACEAMLKMKEMSLSHSEAFHFLEFRHGPKSIVTPNMLIIGILSQQAKEQEVQVLYEMQALGAKVFALGESTTDISVDVSIEFASGVMDPFHSILALPMLQLLAYYRAISKGLNPDQPVHLDKVVRL